MQRAQDLKEGEEVDPTNVKDTACGAELKFAAHVEFFESRDAQQQRETVQEQSGESSSGSGGAMNN